jgi:hypothetical protein
MVGVHWDISWHRSIGRDTFWTAPHIAIYLCGVLGGFAAAYLILRTTFGARERRSSAVRVLGFSGPLGAFILAWGGVAMLTSAPFDDWWHNAYGLDVKIISPPHALLAEGLLTVQIGALVLVLGIMNRAEGPLRKALSALYLYIGGMMLVAVMAFLMERTDWTDMHTGLFYRDVCLAIPLVMVGVSLAGGGKWPATAMATVFTAFQLGLLWVLPLFPAAPKLGPVYVQVSHFVPPPFPLLFLAPALAIDLLRQRIAWARDSSWKAALLTGGAFFGVFLVAQWTFAYLLHSPASHNWVFGTQYFGYDNKPWWDNARNVFAAWETPAAFAINLAIALGLAILASRIGLGLARWLRVVQR